MKLVYGLTGGIASGKSTVARMLEARGATVIDADVIARDVVAPGTPGLDAVIDAFGPTFLVDGALDREALGARVFADDDARAQLSAILNPLISAESAVRIAAAVAGPGDPVFFDAALLVESGMYKNFAGVVVVAASVDTQVARIRARDGLSDEAARQRIAAQAPLDAKLAVADHVIHNDGPLDALESAVDALLAELRA